MKLVPSTALHGGPKRRGEAWGYPFLVEHLPDPVPGQLLVLGAGTNVGKTFMSLAIASAQAAVATGPVVLVELEDAPSEIGRRLDLGLAHPNLYVTFPSEPRLSVILSELEAMTPRPAYVWLDYLQLVKYDNTTPEGRARELMPPWGKADSVSLTTAELKSCFKRLGIPGAVVSQLRRVPTDLRGTFPTIDLLKESGDIEVKADVILMLGGKPKGEHVTMEISKAKNAPVGERLRLRRDVGGRLVPEEDGK